jgi:ABC-type multidrug transport system fused ATPase/permease subunit
VFLLWFSGRSVMTERLSLGDFVALNAYLGMLTWPMMAMGWVVNLFQRGTASLDRVEQLLTEPPELSATEPRSVEGDPHGARHRRDSAVLTAHPSPDTPPGLQRSRHPRSSETRGLPYGQPRAGAPHRSGRRSLPSGATRQIDLLLTEASSMFNAHERYVDSCAYFRSRLYEVNA